MSSSIARLHVAASDALLVREVGGQYRAATSDEVLRRARYVLSRRIRRGASMDSPQAVKDFLRLCIGVLEHEMFSALYMNTQDRLIAFKELFRGTTAQTTVYPREVLKEALKLNASFVILAHNHPSGDAEPSRADKDLTERLQAALAMINVTILDHLVITGDAIVSFAERGLLTVLPSPVALKTKHPCALAPPFPVR